MSRYVSSCDLVERVAAGEVTAIARLISRAEERLPEAQAALAAIYRRAGKAHVVGITGVPGSGKSTLVAVLASRLRAHGGKVAIVAVDPSSPYSGGAILGDRIRMAELASDPGIFIRSMATRGTTGGLARATLDAVDILDVAGYATVIIETVGVGQDEVDIARASHTTIVVTPPGLGDEIQAIKAGMLEIADIHVVTKADRPDASRTLADLKTMLALSMTGSEAESPLPALPVSALSGTGIDELLQAIEHQAAAARETGRSLLRNRAIADFRLRATAETLLLERFAKAAAPHMAAFAERLSAREADPYTLANELIVASRAELAT